MNKSSQHPCPICQTMMVVIGTNNKGKKIGSCGCVFHFRQTRSQKDMKRKYIMTEWGLEKVADNDKSK
jgi:hypothetical protein